jgi:hypothetical protein
MYLVFLSIFGIFNYLRLIKNYRVFIELFKACFSDMQSFIIILAVLMAAFNSAFYVRNQWCPDYTKGNCGSDSLSEGARLLQANRLGQSEDLTIDNPNQNWAGGPDLFSQFKYSLELAFMDNKAVDEENF